MLQQFTDFLTHLASGAVGGLITLLLNHVLSKDRDRTLKREAEIRAERLQLLPLIETTIKQINKEQPLVVWHKQRPALGAAASRFRVILGDRKQRPFDAVWHTLECTKDEEMLHNGKAWFVPGQDAEIIAARKLIIERLTRLYEFIERA